MTVSFLPTPTSSTKTATAFVPQRLPTIRPASTRRQSTSLSSSLQQQQPQQQLQHLVLVGGGHAHVQVIKALNAAARPSNLKITLIDAQKSASYSGMVPGCIAGLYTPDQTLLHLEPLAKYADIQFVHDRVVDIDLERKIIYLRNDQEHPIAFDVISLDIGSTSRGLENCPGARQYSIPTRPIHQLIAKLDQARQEVTDDSNKNRSNNEEDENQTQQPQKLVVIGGGAAGIELSMAITSRWKQEPGLQDTECTILDAGSQLLPGETDEARKSVLELLHSKNIDVRHNCQVTEVTESHIHFRQDDYDQTETIIPYSHCVWATGAGSHRLARHLQHERHLQCDEYGWIQVNKKLQSLSHPFVFAAGDCAQVPVANSNSNDSIPKAGVYAVRAGPILIENLTRYLDSIRQHDNDTDPVQQQQQQQQQPSKPLDLKMYEPQDDFLKLLVCGDGCALGFRFGLVLRGPWVFRLKDDIDQNFMKLFDVCDLPKPVPKKVENGDAVATHNTKYDTSQYDAADAHSMKATPNPQEAALLLQRTDENVDFHSAKVVLRTMGRDATYREAVLRHVQVNLHAALPC